MGTDPGSGGHGGVPPWVGALPLILMAAGPEGFLAGEAIEETFVAAQAAEDVAETTQISAEGLQAVTQHLEQFGEYPPNTAMINRLTQALNSGEGLTGADANFYQHELYDLLNGC